MTAAAISPPISSTNTSPCPDRRQKDGQPGKVEAVKSYDLNPGMAVAYGVGQLHSPKREGETRLIRIEGKNLDTIKRDRYEAI